MKHFFSNHKLTFSVFSISATLLIGYLVLMFNYSQNFEVDTIVGIAKPVAVAALGGVFFSFCFLFFSQNLFKCWLKKIASWYLFGLFLVVANTSVFSSNILFVNRSETIVWGMVILAFITIPFVYKMRNKIG